MRSGTEDDALRDYLRRRVDESAIDPDFRELVRARLDAAHDGRVARTPPALGPVARRGVRRRVVRRVECSTRLVESTGASPRRSASRTTVVERLPRSGPDRLGDGGAPAGSNRRIESKVLRTPLYFDVPPGEDRIVAIAETPDVLEVSLAGPTDIVAARGADRPNPGAVERHHRRRTSKRGWPGPTSTRS